MVTSGSIDVNLDNISDTVNNSTLMASNVTSGIADESDDIGTAIGITISVLFYIGLIVVVLGIIFLIFNWVKSIKGKAKGGM